MTWLAFRMKQATLFAISRRTVIDQAVNITITNTTVMLMYVWLPHGTNAACLPRKALGDVACANIAMYEAVNHYTW